MATAVAGISALALLLPLREKPAQRKKQRNLSMIEHRLDEAFEVVGGDAASGLLILCDHATNRVPPEFHDLGLPGSELARHIAYDIGAAAVSRNLAKLFGCPAVLSRFSRLLIDPNRGEDDPTLVMRIADGALVPGNARIGRTDIQQRIERFYRPYDAAIRETLARMEATSLPPVVLSMHSYTPIMKGKPRPWHATVIWDFDPRLNLALLGVLEHEGDLIVAENEPYHGGYRGDTLDRHVIPAGIAHALVEIRQDLITDADGAKSWGERLHRLLRPLLADPMLRERRVFGAHTD
jgi:predicted N-formylglutamate amidohydrolase